MHLRRVRLVNYKGIRDTGWLDIGRGITVITGRNDVGKTALLEGLSLRFSNKSHLSELAVPDTTHAPSPTSKIHVELAIDPGELKSLLRPYNGTFFLRRIHDVAPDEILKRVLESTTTLSFVRHGSGTLELTSELYFDIAGSLPSARQSFFTRRNEDSYRSTDQVEREQPEGNDLDHIAVTTFIGSLYQFNAERFSVGTCAFGASPTLAANAGNLPEVLNALQGNPARWKRYSALVRRVLGHIKDVSVKPGGSGLQILVWRKEDSEREDLAVPLSECGTGVGQVLAMLYVVATSEQGRTILIDEPTSFLHPGAVTALLQVFREHPLHQYVFSTHTPAVLNAANPELVYLVTANEHETTVRPVNSNEVAEQRRVLDSVGASLADVLGPDRILWVEGPSEAKSFPLITRTWRIDQGRAAILPVVNTGDFDGRKIDTVARIYAALAAGIGLIPPASGFIFDREKRTKTVCDNIKAKVPGRVEFLSRKMFENYLLDPGAIAAWANTFPSMSSSQTTAKDVEQWVVDESKKGTTFDTAHAPWTKEWRDDVHGASLLDGLIWSLSANKDTYDKVRDAPVLTQAVLDTKREDLREIADLLKEFLAA